MDASAGISAINKPADDSGRALTSAPRVKVGARTFVRKLTREDDALSYFRRGNRAM